MMKVSWIHSRQKHQETVRGLAFGQCSTKAHISIVFTSGHTSPWANLTPLPHMPPVCSFLSDLADFPIWV